MKSNFYYSGGNKPVPYSTAPSKYRKRYKDSVRGSGTITAEVTGESILSSTSIVKDFTPNWIRIIFAISIVIIISNLCFSNNAIQNPIDSLKAICNSLSDFGLRVRNVFSFLNSNYYSWYDNFIIDMNATEISIVNALSIIFVKPIGLFAFIIACAFNLFWLIFQIIGILGGALL